MTGATETPRGAPRPLLFLAPMAGVTNTVFRGLCKELGADVLTTEFVSAEGILHRNERTRRYLEFTAAERPVGVQLFGADPVRLGDAVRAVIDWVGPDFIDLNFGCPVNKVVAKNGGSALLRDCPLLRRVAAAVVKAADPLPATAKIRIGWDAGSVNALETARILEGEGIARIAVHGRTKAQGYTGEADWNVIGEVAAAATIPVIGNGDIDSPAIALARLGGSGVAGLMIGRAAMSRPWIFREIRQAIDGGGAGSTPAMDASATWAFILRHCRLEVDWWGGREDEAMRSMRSRLMAYTRGWPGGAALRSRLQVVSSIAAVEEIARDHLSFSSRAGAEAGISAATA